MLTCSALPPSSASRLPFAFVFHLDKHCPFPTLSPWHSHFTKPWRTEIDVRYANFTFCSVRLQEIQPPNRLLGAGWKLLVAFAICWKTIETAELDLSRCGSWYLLCPFFTEPPRWIKEPEGGVYSVGTNLVLLCEAIGNPEPTIQWKLNGMPIDSKRKVPCRPSGGGWVGCDRVVPGEREHTNPRVLGVVWFDTYLDMNFYLLINLMFNCSLEESKGENCRAAKWWYLWVTAPASPHNSPMFWRSGVAHAHWGLQVFLFASDQAQMIVWQGSTGPAPWCSRFIATIFKSVCEDFTGNWCSRALFLGQRTAGEGSALQLAQVWSWCALPLTFEQWGETVNSTVVLFLSISWHSLGLSR